MANELLVAHCPDCGSVFQKNTRNLCASCSALVDEQMQLIERYLVRNRLATTDELASATAMAPQKLRSWIRRGRLKNYDYPNLMDQCDLCSAPIRRGHLCGSCTMRINEDIARTFERERVMKDRMRAAVSYMHKS